MAHPIVMDMLWGLAEYTCDFDEDDPTASHHKPEYGSLAYELYQEAGSLIESGSANQWEVLEKLLPQLKAMQDEKLWFPNEENKPSEDSPVTIDTP